MPDGTCKACLDRNCKRCGADLKCLECNQLPHIEVRPVDLHLFLLVAAAWLEPQRAWLV
jgi:hypothetical protein